MKTTWLPMVSIMGSAPRRRPGRNCANPHSCQGSNPDGGPGSPSKHSRQPAGDRGGQKRGLAVLVNGREAKRRRQIIVVHPYIKRALAGALSCLSLAAAWPESAVAPARVGTGGSHSGPRCAGRRTQCAPAGPAIRRRLHNGDKDGTGDVPPPAAGPPANPPTPGRRRAA